MQVPEENIWYTQIMDCRMWFWDGTGIVDNQGQTSKNMVKGAHWWGEVYTKWSAYKDILRMGEEYGARAIGYMRWSWSYKRGLMEVRNQRLCIWTMRNCFSSLNCSSGNRDQRTCSSPRNWIRTILIVMEAFQECKKFIFISPKDRFYLRGLLGIRDKYLNILWSAFNVGRGTRRLTLNTWNASNWIFLLLSRRRFIIIFKFASLAMYRVITLKLARSRRISPSSFRDCRLVT